MLKSEDLVQLVDYGRNDTVPELVRAAEEERAAERAAVVAWLRECALDPETTGAEMRLFQTQATAIERGEHRREEE